MEITTSITINATAEKVWNILADFKNYPNWNPFITSINGELKEGSIIEATMVPPDASVMKFKPTLLVVEENKELRWKGKLLVKGLFDGEHYFYITDNKNGTATFTQGEKFSGILVPLFKKMITVNTKNGFMLMNEALKKRAEE